MQIAKISTKGQITVPKLARKILNIMEGDSVAFTFEEGNIIIRKADINLLQRVHEKK